MRVNDEITAEHIEFIESQLLVLEVENEELKQTVKSLMVQLQQYHADRTFAI